MEKKKYSFWVEQEYDFMKSLSETQKKESNAPTLNFNWDNNSKYKIEIATTLFFMGKPVSDNKTESIWQVSFIESDNTIHLDVVDKKNIKLDSQIKPLMEIIDQINKTTNSLELKLDKNKTIERVSNLKPILKKWETVKFEDLKFHQLADDHFNQIIRAYDFDFNNLHDSLKNNVLYQLFFYPQGLVKYPIQSTQIIATNKKTNSQLFPQHSVFYDLMYKSKIENEKIIVSCFTGLNEKFDKKLIMLDYEKNYASLLSSSFSYKFLIEGQYTHSMQGQLEKAVIYIKEQASSELYYVSQYNFTLLNEDKLKDKL